MVEQAGPEKKQQVRMPEAEAEPSLFFEQSPQPKGGKGKIIFLILFLVAGLAFLGRSTAIQGEAVLKAKNFVKVDIADPAILKEIFHKEGDVVGAGEVLARLENPEVLKELQEKKLALEMVACDEKLLEQKKEFFSKKLVRKNILMENGASTRAEIETIELEVARAAEELSIKQKQTESLQNELSFLKLRQDSLQIKAPLRGIIVTDPTLRIGNYVRPGDVLFHLADPASFYLELAIPERIVERLRIGNQVSIRFQAFPSIPFTGTLARVGTMTRNEVEKVFKVRHVILCEIALNGMPPHPRFGMHALVRIRTKSSIPEGIESQISDFKEKISFQEKKIGEDLPLSVLNSEKKKNEDEKK